MWSRRKRTRAIVIGAVGPREKRESFGLTEGLLRLSGGIGDIADLEADLQRGLGT